MKTRKCNFVGCGKEYEFQNSTSKYCSGTCRAKASALNGLSAITTPHQKEIFEEPQPRRISMPTVSGEVISPQAQFMIDQLKKEADRWEEYYKEQKTKREKLKEENEKLRTELATLKTDHAIEAAAKPNGLNGFIESPGFAAMAPYIGPILQKLGENVLTPQPAQIGSGNVVDNTPVAQFNTWLGTLGETTRTQVMNLLKYLSTQDEGTVARTIAQMQSMGMMGMFAHRTG